MKKKIRTKRNQMRAYPTDKIRGRLSRKGWFASTIDGVMKVGDEEIPVQTEVWNHETLGKKLRLEEANIAQKRHEEELKEEFPKMASAYLLEKGWTLTEAGNWFKPHWNPQYNILDDDEDDGDAIIAKGHYTNLRNAYSLQLKLDSAPEVEGLEESLEDMMLMSHADEFGA